MRVLVTRPQADAARTAERLERRGHVPLVAPLLTVERTGAAVPGGAFDAVVLTSVNAVPALLEIRDAVAGRPVVAVGPRTADVARAAGFAHVTAAEGDAEALSALVRRILPPGAELLHVAGRERKPEPEASLRAAGYGVLVWEAYAAAAVARLPQVIEAALKERTLDAALHFSRRSAAVLVVLAREAELLEPLRALAHGCLSQDVAAPLVQIGAAQCMIASRPDEASLLDTLPTGGESDGSHRSAPWC